MSNSNSPPKVPVLPHWCDVNSWDYKKQILFYGICYIVIGLTKVIYSISIFINFSLPVGLNLIIWAIFVIGIVQICVTIYFMKKAQIYDFKVIRQWLFCIIGIIIVYFTVYIAFLCSIPFDPRNFYFLGFKIIMIPVLDYRMYSKYYKPNQQELLN